MSDQATSPNPQAATPEAGGDINVLDLLVVVAKHKAAVLGFPVIAAVVAAIVTVLMPNIYTATTTILPPQQNQPATATMLSQLGGLGGIAGAAFGMRNPSEVYVGMLKSRTIADTIIKRFGLDTRFQVRLVSDARAALRTMTEVRSGKDGMITIDVSNEDASLATQLANGYVEELSRLTGSLALTDASRRRLFFENQLMQAKDNLAKAEMVATQSLKRGGIVQAEGQGRAMIESAARLRAQITIKQVQLDAMRAFATDNNPELKMTQGEVAAMRAELARLEGAGRAYPSDTARGNGDGVSNLILLRNVKYYETVYDLLSKQYELAKIDEAKDPALIQTLDLAVVPDQKSKPRRTLIVVLTALTAAVLAVFWAFFAEGLQKARHDPQQAERFGLLNRYLRWR